ncbi:hypothetical protein [uncultured Rothia sp.]|uniref:hypothetical protein n=1 Tax=uncultured Rothia sp. TaxID=316088 RepID=UPI0028DCC746|nr:hypothetical protein [uncultured Rothia sp.]
MKTYILASIFTDKKSLEEFENNDGNKEKYWISGVPDVKYFIENKNKDGESKDLEEHTSNAEKRWDNFSETIWHLLYKDNHRYYTEKIKSHLEVEEANEVYKYPVTRIQVLLAEKNICLSDEIPGLAVLEVEVPKEETGKEFKINIKNVYQYLAKNQLIPGLKIDEDAKRDMDESEGDKLRKSMWKKNIKDFMFTVQIANSFNSFGSSNTPKKIMDIGPYSRKKFINELHVLVDSKGASYDAQKKWEKESPRGLNILGSGDWCFYARSKGVVYYIPFQPKEVEEEFLPHFFQGYAESFHLDAIMLSILKNILVTYYTNQIQDRIKSGDNLAIKEINNTIKKMYIMYDMGRTVPRGGQHNIVMAKVEYALHFQDNLNVLIDSTERIEEANSVQRQENLAISQEKLAKSQEELARYALLVAMVMIIPGAVSFLNDGSSVLKDIGIPCPLCLTWTSLVIVIVIAFIIYKQIEEKGGK